jgi:hypothetical protein
MYDPKIGQFLSEDPIEFDGQDENLHRYVYNNPVSLIDPDGLTAVEAGGVILGPNGEEFGPTFDDAAIAAAYRAQFGDLRMEEYRYLAQRRLEWELEYYRQLMSGNAAAYERVVAQLYQEWDRHVVGCPGEEDALLNRALTDMSNAEWVLILRTYIHAQAANPFRDRMVADLGFLGWAEMMMRTGPHTFPGGGIYRGPLRPGSSTPRPPDWIPLPAGFGTRARVPPNATKFRPLEGKWAAVMKNGKVYVHHMHVEATKMANGGKLGPTDRYGMVDLDCNGVVIGASWGE